MPVGGKTYEKDFSPTVQSSRDRNLHVDRYFLFFFIRKTVETIFTSKGTSQLWTQDPKVFCARFRNKGSVFKEVFI